MEVLDPTHTVLESLEWQHPKASKGALRTLLGAFGFSGDDHDKPCRVLSGGEKARVVLAGMLFDPPNFLVLDEPTNHLDMETKEMLVKALGDFDGTMLFVSHDRTFLRALSNRVLELIYGMQTGIVIERFLKGIAPRFEPSEGNIKLNGVIVDVDEESGQALRIERISLSHK